MGALENRGDGPDILKTSLDLFPQEVVMLDGEFNILWLNKAKQTAHPDLALGMKCYQAFHFSERCPFCLADQAKEFGRYLKNPVCIMTGARASVPRHVNVMVAPFPNAGLPTGEAGIPAGAAGMPAGETGILEIIDNVESLYQSHHELERLNHEYESVIYALSHDLRSPLISIEGFVAKLAKSQPDPSSETTAHCMERIRANVKIMNGLVNVLLDTSRIITGILDLHEVDMEKLVQEMAEQFANRAAEQNARIRVRGAFGFERCDRIRITQVYANLIGNALKHSRDVKDLEIELGADDHVYWVKDNGPGIPEHFQDTVFEPFTQGAKNLKESFGMGMNIVFRIMQKHDGEIWLDSKEGKGTTVFFSFRHA